jgi:hypothetical protein
MADEFVDQLGLVSGGFDGRGFLNERGHGRPLYASALGCNRFIGAGAAQHGGYIAAMKIQQNQLWQKGDEYYRVVHRDRISVVYKTMKNPAAKGEQKNATKKEFCRMLKGAVLLPGTPQAQSEESDEADFDPESETPPSL